MAKLSKKMIQKLLKMGIDPSSLQKQGKALVSSHGKTSFFPEGSIVNKGVPVGPLDRRDSFFNSPMHVVIREKTIQWKALLRKLKTALNEKTHTPEIANELGLQARKQLIAAGMEKTAATNSVEKVLKVTGVSKLQSPTVFKRQRENAILAAERKQIRQSRAIALKEKRRQDLLTPAQLKEESTKRVNRALSREAALREKQKAISEIQQEQTVELSPAELNRQAQIKRRLKRSKYKTGLPSGKLRGGVPGSPDKLEKTFKIRTDIKGIEEATKRLGKKAAAKELATIDNWVQKRGLRIQIGDSVLAKKYGMDNVQTKIFSTIRANLNEDHWGRTVPNKEIAEEVKRRVSKRVEMRVQSGVTADGIPKYKKVVLNQGYGNQASWAKSSAAVRVKGESTKKSYATWSNTRASILSKNLRNKEIVLTNLRREHKFTRNQAKTFQQERQAVVTEIRKSSGLRGKKLKLQIKKFDEGLVKNILARSPPKTAKSVVSAVAPVAKTKVADVVTETVKTVKKVGGKKMAGPIIFDPGAGYGGGGGGELSSADAAFLQQQQLSKSTPAVAATVPKAATTAAAAVNPVTYLQKMQMSVVKNGSFIRFNAGANTTSIKDSLWKYLKERYGAEEAEKIGKNPFFKKQIAHAQRLNGIKNASGTPLFTRKQAAKGLAVSAEQVHRIHNKTAVQLSKLMGGEEFLTRSAMNNPKTLTKKLHNYFAHGQTSTVVGKTATKAATTGTGVGGTAVVAGTGVAATATPAAVKKAQKAAATAAKKAAALTKKASTKAAQLATAAKSTAKGQKIVDIVAVEASLRKLVQSGKMTIEKAQAALAKAFGKPNVTMPVGHVPANFAAEFTVNIPQPGVAAAATGAPGMPVAPVNPAVFGTPAGSRAANAMVDRVSTAAPTAIPTPAGAAAAAVTRRMPASVTASLGRGSLESGAAGAPPPPIAAAGPVAKGSIESGVAGAPLTPAAGGAARGAASTIGTVPPIKGFTPVAAGAGSAGARNIGVGTMPTNRALAVIPKTGVGARNPNWRFGNFAGKTGGPPGPGGALAKIVPHFSINKPYNPTLMAKANKAFSKMGGLQKFGWFIAAMFLANSLKDLALQPSQNEAALAQQRAARGPQLDAEAMTTQALLPQLQQQGNVEQASLIALKQKRPWANVYGGS